MPDFFW
ncbi:hypothetical protein RDI58_004129 [Solanum bulbocastanum]